MRSGAAASGDISEHAQEQLSQININLGSSATFEKQIAGLDVTDTERAELVKIEAKSRYDSVRVAYAVGAVIVLAALATTPAIGRSGTAGAKGQAAAKAQPAAKGRPAK